MRVTVPQPAHHAHFCCFQAVPGMLNYVIISNSRFINMRFNGKFAYNYFLCHHFDLVCNFLTFNLYTQSWNLDCFSSMFCIRKTYYIMFCTMHYVLYSQMECTQNLLNQMNRLFLIIINNKYYYCHSYCCFTVFKLTLKIQNIHISRFWTWHTDDHHIGLSLISDLEILLLKRFNDRNEMNTYFTFTLDSQKSENIFSHNTGHLIRFVGPSLIINSFMFFFFIALKTH